MKVKKIFVTVMSLIATACLLFSFTACNINNGNNGDTVAVTSVTLDSASLTLNIGETRTLSAIVMPANATDKTEKWISSDSSVATVSNGVVTAVGAGTAAIRLTVGGKSSICNVTVIDPSKQTVFVTGVTLDKPSMQLEKGDVAKLTATITPADATYKSVTWTSSNSKVAAVANGTVYAIGRGTAILTVTAYREQGSSITYTSSCVVTVTSTESGGEDDPGNSSSSDLYVAKVSSLANRTQPFIMGMDASAVPSIEEARKASNSPLYKNFDGNEEDVFKIMADNGITDIRIRVWNNPNDTSDRTYGGGKCDVANAVAIAARCKEAGLGVIIDFHYSDFWADPAKQYLPKEWKSYSTTQVAQAIYDFTKDSLVKIQATGVTITMVQVGNEINPGMAGSKDWTVVSNYINKGSQAVREVTGTVAQGGAKVAVHFTNPEKQGYKSIAQTLKNNSVDYDVFGTSYYPYWHGTLTNLSSQLKQVHDSFGKEVMVLETSYAFTNNDADGLGNTGLDTITQPITVQGQSNAVRSVIETIAAFGDWGLGVCYWEGTWIAASSSTSWRVNQPLCETYGCGWATQYAHGYDSDAPTSGSGGSMVDNQAFWDSETGMPLESLKVFKLVYTGQTGDIKADVLYDQEDYYTVGVGTITLPATVTVVLNNGSEQAVTAYWNYTAEQLEEYIHTVGTHTITGTTDYGGTCYFYAWVMNPNLLTAGSFEEDEGVTGYGATDKFIQTDGLGGWTLQYTKATSDLQLYVSTDSNNARMGSQSFHFWDSGTVKFTLSQTLTAAQLGDIGKFGGYIEIQGNFGANMDVHVYVTITYSNGQTKTIKGNSITGFEGWQKWQRTSISGVEIGSDVTKVEFGISVYAEVEEGTTGPWGNIDNAQFYFEG